MKLIKYENRKLYSPKTGYRTYPQVAAHLQNGGTIQVTCGRTRLDITTSVLRKCMEYKANLSDTEIYDFLRK